MKYILMCLVVLALCVLLTALLVNLINKRLKLKKTTLVFSWLFVFVILISIFCFLYLSFYYHADFKEDIKSESVAVNKIEGGYFFDGPGNKTALIFYPGAQVEALAYSSLMTRLAENGIDCFVAEMPFKLALFDSDAAKKFLDNYNYENWVAAGHSIGGYVISKYLGQSDKINALILLGSYPAQKIADEIKLISIYGSCDRVLDLYSYRNAKDNWPKNFYECVIEGGNHANFGNYGIQKGDGKEEIESSLQQKYTVDFILNILTDN